MSFPGPCFKLVFRFTPEEKAKRHPCAYMPFGYGPRNCIGMRFALLEAKMALIEIVRKFKIVLAPETKARTTQDSIIIYFLNVPPQCAKFLCMQIVLLHSLH